MQITHTNFGWLHAPPLPPACCHCLVIRGESGVVLIDTGIGLHDIADPEGRIGRDVIDAAGFKFIPAVTAVRQLARLNIEPGEVTDIVLTHCDPDHAGGLSDFPNAKVHVAAEEKDDLDSGNPRYSRLQFAHGVDWITYGSNDSETWGLPSRKVQTAAEAEIRLVPLFGHTRGHCGVAVADSDRWALHAGDAYYLRGELTNPAHPINELAAARADDNESRLASLSALRELTSREGDRLTCFGYHDIAELPDGIPMPEDIVKGPG